MSQTSSCCGQGRCPGLRELWLPRRALGPGRLGSEQPRFTVPFPGHGGQRAGSAPPAPAPRRAPLPDTDASDPACPAEAGAFCPRGCGRAMSGLGPPAAREAAKGRGAPPRRSARPAPHGPLPGPLCPARPAVTQRPRRARPLAASRRVGSPSSPPSHPPCRARRPGRLRGLLAVCPPRSSARRAAPDSPAPAPPRPLAPRTHLNLLSMVTSRAPGGCSSAPQEEAPRPAGARGQRRPLSLGRRGRLSAAAAAGGGPWLLRSPGSGRDCSGAAAPPPPPVSQFLLRPLRHLLGTRKLRGGPRSRWGRCHLSPAGVGLGTSWGPGAAPRSGAPALRRRCPGRPGTAAAPARGPAWARPRPLVGGARQRIGAEAVLYRRDTFTPRNGLRG